MIQNTNVLLHLRGKNTPDVDFVLNNFWRLPAEGEYIIINDNENYYKVMRVIHCAFAKTEYTAELYAVRVDNAEYIRTDEIPGGI
jgi:hypothetical protein